MIKLFSRISRQQSCLYFLCIILSIFSSPLFSESAPVYDVEEAPQQMEAENMPPQIAEQAQQDAMEETESSPLDENASSPMADERGFMPAESASPAKKGTLQNETAPARNLAPSQVQAANESTSRLPLDQRLRQIEQRVNNLQASESLDRMESLQNQVQSLRSQVEQLTRQLQQIQDHQKLQATTAVRPSLPEVKAPSVTVSTSGGSVPKTTNLPVSKLAANSSQKAKISEAAKLEPTVEAPPAQCGRRAENISKCLHLD